jgi:nitroreductase
MSPLDTLLTRRSAQTFTGVEPSAEQLELVLRAATTVPDHGRMRPWRLVVVHSCGRESFAAALVSAGQARDADLPQRAVSKLREKAFVAPVQVVIVSSPVANDKVPVWEQEASAACAGYAMALAAHAQGLGAVWKTAPFRRGAGLDALLELGEQEQILGWINLGVAASLVVPRASVDLSEVVTHVTGVDPAATAPG